MFAEKEARPLRSLYWARELPEAESILPIGAITSFLGALLFLQFLAILGDGGSGKSGKSVRLVSKPKPEGMTKEVCCVNYEAVVGVKTVKSRCLSLVFRKPVCVVDPSKQFLIDIFCFFNHNVGCPPSGIRLRCDRCAGRFQWVGQPQCDYQIWIRQFFLFSYTKKRSAGEDMPVCKCNLCFLHFDFCIRISF